MPERAPGDTTLWVPPVPTFTLLTGAAGCGKTFATRDWAARDRGILLCATTGIAAINLGGTTINALLGYFDTKSLLESYTGGWLTAKLGKLWKAGARRLVLDEVSMLDGDQLTYLVKAIEEVNGRGYVLSKRDPDDADGDQGEMGLTLVGDFCFGLGTSIMRMDGSLITVEAVKVGDQLRGPDGRPRTVLQITRGIDQLYQVQQTNGDSYVVNSRHLLALRRSESGKRSEEWGVRYPAHKDQCFLTASDLAKRSQKFREHFVGYRVGVIQLPTLHVQIDPYLLGLWLGDGDQDGARITTADQEIMEACQQIANREGWRLRTQEWRKKHTPARRLSFSSADYRSPHSLRARLKRYGLLLYKHIPHDYQLNDVETRLALLAGLLDSDGSWTGNRYSITQVREHLARQIKQLADQLGFRTGIRHVRASDAWCVTIGGDTWRIPCRVRRKQSVPRSLRRSRLTSVLAIEPLTIGEYAGFEVDGDHLFLLGDGTVAHNCQLPPVKAPFAFESTEWTRFEEPGARITLTEIRRQADPGFIEALRAARVGDAEGTLAYFGPRLERVTDDQFPGPTLLAKNESVDRYNWIRMNKLQGADCYFRSTREGKQRSEWGNANKPPATWGIPQQLHLKIGALVMILANKKLSSSTAFLYVNGDLGDVVAADDARHTCDVRLHRSGQVVTVEYIRREVLTPLDTPRRKALVAAGQADKISDDGRWEIEGWIEYLPIRVAYASTVHRSQGLSLDRVQVNISDAFFSASGMLYVALSRARTAEGLRLVGSREALVARCTVDPRLRAWL